MIGQHVKAAFQAAIAQGKIPRYLYKYTSVDNCLHMINDGTLYFADYHQFNDPFECKALIDTKNTKEEWYKYLLQNGVNAHKAAIMAKQIVCAPRKAEKIVNECVQENHDSTGFLCLTAKRDNLLMWAHYAKQHEGCCVKLDILNDVDVFCRIKAVVYNNNYIHYNYLQNNGGALDTICHKSREWEYEEEYRVMSFNHIGVKPMLPGTLKEIYLGCRMIVDDKNKILDAVASTTKQPNVEVFQAMTDEQSYKLNFVKIN